MLNTRCPNCNEKVRGHEYNRKRQSYLTSFDCPHCGAKLTLAREVYLWFVLIFQIIPTSILSAQATEGIEDILSNISLMLMLVGCVGLLLRFRYQRAETS